LSRPPRPTAAGHDADAHDIFHAAFEDLGGAEGLMRWARNNPAQFYALYAKRIAPTAEAATAWAVFGDTPLLTEAEWSERARTKA